MTGAALARSVPPFEAVISPYHLTTREPAAMVTLQLAERATTLLLAPIAARVGVEVEMATVHQQARTLAPYRQYMSSWEWVEPLFREGLIGSVHDGEDPVDDVRAACTRLATDEALAALARYARPEIFADDRAYLAAASADVLKAGPDPGVSIPIAAGLDAFAGAHRMVVARSAPVSLAQKAESRMGRVLFRVGVPALLQGSAERVLLVRALLDGPRERLARAIAAAFETGDADAVRDAAAHYARAFERERADICSPPGRDEEDEVRMIVGETAIIGLELPADAVLRSSLAAVSGRAGTALGEPGPATVRTLVLRPLGSR